MFFRSPVRASFSEHDGTAVRFWVISNAMVTATASFYTEAQAAHEHDGTAVFIWTISMAMVAAIVSLYAGEQSQDGTAAPFWVNPRLPRRFRRCCWPVVFWLYLSPWFCHSRSLVVQCRSGHYLPLGLRDRLLELVSREMVSALPGQPGPDVLVTTGPPSSVFVHGRDGVLSHLLGSPASRPSVLDSGGRGAVSPTLVQSAVQSLARCSRRRPCAGSLSP